MIKILIVEDEKAISDLLRLSLTKAGYSATCAYDGLGAADLLERDRFDLILLDIMLPGVNGYDLMEYIRPLEIPVIFITAKNSVHDRVKGLRMGADDYIVKPFEIVELLARVEAVLHRYNKIQQVIEIHEEFPEVHFAGINFSYTASNVSAMAFNDLQSGFMAGAFAGSVPQEVQTRLVW